MPLLSLTTPRATVGDPTVFWALALLLLASVPREVSATFSLAAVDSSNQQIGAVGASCVPESVFDVLYHSVPGRGIVMTQALPPPAGSAVYRISTELLTNGASPDDLLERITDPEVDVNGESLIDGTRFPGPSLRQYGVVALPLSSDRNAETAGHTGAGIPAFYVAVGLTEDSLGSAYTQEHQGGQKYEYTYSAQGNIVSADTVPTLAETFDAAETACDLADRLMMAFAAIFETNSTGGDPFLGDVRCISLPASSAFLHVDNPDGTELIHIDIVEGENVTAGESPFVPLKEAYDAWRVEYPCPIRVIPSEAPTGVPTTSPSSAPTSAPTSSASCRRMAPILMGNVLLWATAVTLPLFSLF